VSHCHSSARIEAGKLPANPGGVHQQPEETRVTSAFRACPALTVPRRDACELCVVQPYSAAAAALLPSPVGSGDFLQE